MQIFAGSMTGIRNPKAHSNITIDAPRAIHFCIWQVCFMPCLMSDYETSTKAKQNQDPFRWSQLTGVLGAKAFPLRPSRNQLVSKTTNSPGRKCARTKLIYCIITYLKNKLSK